MTTLRRHTGLALIAALITALITALIVALGAGLLSDPNAVLEREQRLLNPAAPAPTAPAPRAASSD